MPAHPRLRAAVAAPALMTLLLAGLSGATPTSATAAAAFPAAAFRPAPSVTMDVRRSSLTEPRLSRSGPRPARAAKPMKVERRVVISKPLWMTPVATYHLTSRFGDVSWLWSSGVHTGLDFAAPTGTPIRSITEGVVTEAGWAGSYGYRTIVRLPGGSEAWYCHQNALAVQVGQQLSAGQLIGYVGSTGNVTGPHVHLEIRRGDTPVDPAAVLAAHGVNS